MSKVVIGLVLLATLAYAAPPAACPSLLTVGVACPTVRTLQANLVKLKLLAAGAVTGKYDAATATAVGKFQTQNKLNPGANLGKAGATTITAIATAAASGADTGNISPNGRKQMARLLAWAKSHNSGSSHGQCYAYVWKYIMAVGYGKISGSHFPGSEMGSAYARDFAIYMNKPGIAEKWGLRRLKINNPYDAPAGAIIVVKAGTPGTANPVAGDIAIKSDVKMSRYGAPNSFYFINDGPYMNYHDPRRFTQDHGVLLGAYVPL